MRVQQVILIARISAWNAMLTAAVAAVLLLQGCVAAPILAEAAGPAIDKSMELARFGKTESFQAVTMDEMLSAVRQAAQELDLTHVTEAWSGDKLHLVYTDDKKQQVKINLEPRTPNVTYILVDVGWFGLEGLGRLSMRQILHDLPARVRPDSAYEWQQ